MFTLFRILTLDDWTNVLLINQHGCSNYPHIYDIYPAKCTHPEPLGIIAVLYFIVVVVFGAQVILTLFIGTVTANMEEAKNNKIRLTIHNKKLSSVRAKMDLTRLQMKCFNELFDLLDTNGDETVDANEMNEINELIKINFNRNFQNISLLDKQCLDLPSFIDCICQLPILKHKKILRRFIRNFLFRRDSKKSLATSDKFKFFYFISLQNFGMKNGLDNRRNNLKLTSTVAPNSNFETANSVTELVPI